MKKERNKAVPAAYMMLEKEGKVLLIRRFNTGYQDGSYSLPAGHVDAGELPIETAIRETKEEVGVEIQRADVSLAHIYYREARDETGDRVGFIYRTTKWTGEVRNCEPEKCDEVAWYSLEALPPNLVLEFAQVIPLIQKGIVFSETKANELP